ncbi:MAG: 30S ribosomal protein S20 [Dehalococcoidia bacterium]
MASRSAAKAWRKSEERRLRNRARRSTAKTFVRRAEVIMNSGDPQTAVQAVRMAISVLDRAAQKGALHPRNVARRKARLMKKYSTVLATATVPEEKAPVPKRGGRKEKASAQEVAKKRRPSKKKEK